MKSLADALRETEADRESAKFGQWIRDVIYLAIGPFAPKVMTLELTYGQDFYFSDLTLSLELDILPNHPFKYKFNEREIHQAHDFYAYLKDSISKPLFEHFRYRPSLPVEEHIVLGEE